jgi:hypothetical protein
MSESPGAGPQRWKRLLIAAIFIVVIAGAIVISQVSARAAPDQPIEFSHRTHSQAEIDCLFCHPNPLRSDIAGIPSVQRCVGCHRIIASDREQVQEVLGYGERGEPIPWVPVQFQPDHVIFSHHPHIRSGIACETCHGDVAAMSVTRPAFIMDMGWCLSCHQEQPEEKVARLTDCLACHK